MKKLITIILAALMLMALASCNSDDGETEKKDKKKDKETEAQVEVIEDETEESDEEETETIPEVEEPEGEKYESDTFHVLEGTDEIKDIFVKYVDDDANNFLTTDGKILPVDDLDCKWWYDSEVQNIVEEVQIGRFPSCIDDKGFLYIYEGGTVYPVSGVKGEVKWYFQGMMDGMLYVFSVENGSIYLTTFDSAGIKGNYDGELIYIYDYMTKTYYDKFETIEVYSDTYTEIVAISGNTLLKGNITGVDNFSGKAQIWITAIAVDADHVVSYDGLNYVYKKDGDSTTLYYGQNELPLPLPDGKTVDQLTKIVFASTTAMFFDDGSVYIGELTGTIAGPTFEKNEELTALNAQGMVKEVYYGDGTLKFLMDDNVTYVLNVEEEEYDY